MMIVKHPARPSEHRENEDNAEAFTVQWENGQVNKDRCQVIGIAIERNRNCENRRGSYWSVLPAMLAVLAFTGLFPLPPGPLLPGLCLKPGMRPAEEVPPGALSALRYIRAPGQGCNCQPLKDIKRQGGKPSSLRDRLFRVLTACKKKKNVNSYPVRYYFMLLPLGCECYAERGDRSGNSASVRTENSTLTPHNKCTTSRSQPDSGIFFPGW